MTDVTEEKINPTPNWDDATRVGNFVVLEQDTEKVLVITNWELQYIDKFDKEQIELTADVAEEDGKKVEDRKFSTTSSRLKKKLRPLLEGKDRTTRVKVSILKVGDKFDTQYSVKLVE